MCWLSTSPGVAVPCELCVPAWASRARGLCFSDMMSESDEGVKRAASDGLRVEVGRVVSCSSTGVVANLGDDGIDRSGVIAVDMVPTGKYALLIYYS